MTNTTHHLTAHWVLDGNDAEGTHHPLREVWLDEEEAPVTISKIQDLDPAAA
jgi:hypothetical protein